MALRDCNELECFTNNKNKLQFCDKCTKELINNLSTEDLYDIYGEALIELNRHINGEDEEEKTAAIICKKKLYKCINKIMLLKIKQDKIDIDWPY